MNTQTHLLLAAALFARPGKKLRNSAAICGALVPDLSLYVMWAGARLTGIPERTIWRDLYWRPEWQEIGAITNSVPVYFALVLLAVGLGSKLSLSAEERVLRPGDSHLSKLPEFKAALLVFALSALVHIGTDFPLHADDARPHFWPFSSWVYHSPISYWDPNHHGTLASALEILLALSLIVVLWRRFSDLWVRALLVLAALSFAGVALYWLSAFG